MPLGLQIPLAPQQFENIQLLPQNMLKVRLRRAWGYKPLPQLPHSPGEFHCQTGSFGQRSTRRKYKILVRLVRGHMEPSWDAYTLAEFTPGCCKHSSKTADLQQRQGTGLETCAGGKKHTCGTPKPTLPGNSLPLLIANKFKAVVGSESSCRDHSLTESSVCPQEPGGEQDGFVFDFHTLHWWLRHTSAIPALNKLSLENNSLAVLSSLHLGAQRGENSTSF